MTNTAWIWNFTFQLSTLKLHWQTAFKRMGPRKPNKRNEAWTSCLSAAPNAATLIHLEMTGRRDIGNIPEFTTHDTHRTAASIRRTLSDTRPTKANKFIARGHFYPTPPYKERQSRFLPINKGVI